jgi:DNA mismatch repair protein MutS
MEEAMTRYTPMIQQYLTIKETVPDAILFFRLGDFYEMFFDDAEQASKELEITLTGRDGGSDKKIPMCGVPHHSAENYIQRLIDKGYKVAICEQVEDPATAKGVVKREIVRIITPGTILESKTIDDKRNHFIAAVYKNDQNYGVAACDLTTGEFLVTETDLDKLLLLEEIGYFQPSELIVEENSINGEIASDIKQRFAIPISLFPYIAANDHHQQFWIQQQDENLNQTMDFTCRFLYSYLQETQKRVLPHLQPIQVTDSHHFLILDHFSRRNLELTETVRDKSKKGSLLALLDQTHTSMGGRLLRRWLEKPLTHLPSIERRLEAIETLYGNLILREDLVTSLKEVYDLERLMGKVAYGNVGPKEVVALKHSLEQVPDLAQHCLNSSSSTLTAIFQNADLCQDVATYIGQALVEDPPGSIKEGGFVRQGFHPQLDQYRQVRSEGKNWLAQLEQKERQATGIKSLKIGYNKVFGYYIEVTKANLATLPDDRYERKQTLANAERFITPELKEREALILEAEEKMNELEVSLFHEIRLKIAMRIAPIQILAKKIAEVDVYQSMAKVAINQNYTRPKLTDQYDLFIERGRHPVVEAVLDQSSFIANPTGINQAQRVMLITGPNMAGKSTYMRQVALIVLMAHMGSFVPADRATIPIIDRIFTRIGAADDLVGGQSTFMVEMKDIQTMTLHATNRSLVIIDELGRGTSTEEGMAIAQSVIEYLHHQVQCKTLVSTHFHELSHLEEELTSLFNYSMAVKESSDEVNFLRQLKRGAAGKSYGIYCAKIAGLPDSIILRAEQLLLRPKEDSLATEKADRPVQEVAAARQLSLFEDSQTPPPQHDTGSYKVIRDMVAQLDAIDPMHVTPLQAMQILFELKQKFSHKKYR